MFSDGIGVLYEPRKIRKEADAQVYKLEKIATAIDKINFNGDIEIKDNKISISNEKIINDKIKQIVTSEIKRIYNEKKNLINIADIAYTELENDDLSDNFDIDYDWINNFFNYGRKIYNSDIQFIFGKILAGEIKKPGSFSKRLLSILSNLSQDEAKIFSKISKLTLKSGNKSFIIADDNIINDYNVKVEDIILLEEIGLINSTLLVISNNNIYEYKDYLIEFNNKPKFRVYFLTKSGCELEKIINSEIDINYLKKVKSFYNIEKITYYKIISKEVFENTINYKHKIVGII